MKSGFLNKKRPELTYKDKIVQEKAKNVRDKLLILFNNFREDAHKIGSIGDDDMPKSHIAELLGEKLSNDTSFDLEKELISDRIQNIKNILKLLEILKFLDLRIKVLDKIISGDEALKTLSRNVLKLFGITPKQENQFYKKIDLSFLRPFYIMYYEFFTRNPLEFFLKYSKKDESINYRQIIIDSACYKTEAEILAKADEVNDEFLKFMHNEFTQNIDLNRQSYFNEKHNNTNCFTYLEKPKDLNKLQKIYNIIGAIILHRGKLSELNDDELKTLKSYIINKDSGSNKFQEFLEFIDSNINLALNNKRISEDNRTKYAKEEIPSLQSLTFSKLTSFSNLLEKQELEKLNLELLEEVTGNKSTRNL